MACGRTHPGHNTDLLFIRIIRKARINIAGFLILAHGLELEILFI